jgi:hypothetical protein
VFVLPRLCPGVPFVIDEFIEPADLALDAVEPVLLKSKGVGVHALPRTAQGVTQTG